MPKRRIQPRDIAMLASLAEGRFLLAEALEWLHFGDLPWLRKGWVVYPEDALGRHLVLIGASGMGKSETALRLAAGAANAYGWQVFFLDAKGDRTMADRFWAAMRATSTQRLAMLPQRANDGWRGDATALLNRLLSIVDFSEAYYRDLSKMVLSLALDAPQGPPRSSQELLERLNLDALRRLYEGHPDEHELEGLQEELIAATYNRYRAFFRALRGQLDGDWAWEDVDAGYLLLDGLALKDQAVSLGRYLLEDFAHYVAIRKDPARRVLLIVDEFSALAMGGTDIDAQVRPVRRADVARHSPPPRLAAARPSSTASTSSTMSVPEELALGARATAASSSNTQNDAKQQASEPEKRRATEDYKGAPSSPTRSTSIAG